LNIIIDRMPSAGRWAAFSVPKTEKRGHFSYPRDKRMAYEHGVEAEGTVEKIAFMISL
jgi:hypothetical protein